MRRAPSLWARARALVRDLRDDAVRFEPSCVVPDDPGEVVRHAGPADARARQQLREQHLATLRRDPAAVAARERRMAIEAGRVATFRRRA